MEEETKHLWYQPATQEPDNGEELDLFEEAGLYDLKNDDELFREYAERLQRPKAKKRRWKSVLGVSMGVIVLLALIIGTAVLFARPEEPNTAGLPFPDDEFDYSQYFDNSIEHRITGENTIPKADLDPTVQLKLESSESLEPLELQTLYDRCISSVVGVSSRLSLNQYGWGTGIVMTEDGYILTNTHVIEGASSVQISLYDGETYEAKLVGADAVSDVAVLKIEATGLTPAVFADSDQVAVGDRAIAIGNPLSGTYSGTMTDGIISGVSRNVSYGGHTSSLIQTNAALNEGNSGGPLFNAYGQVVGITNMKMMTTRTATVEGIGFAIPTVTVKSVADELLANGTVKGRPCLGIYVYELSESTDEYPRGLLVDSLSKESDAYHQGVQADDIITKIDGESITDFDMVSEKLSEMEVGDSVTLTIWRNGKILEKTVKLMDQNDY